MSAQGTSTSSVLTSLATNAIFFGAFVGAFLVLRLKYKRIYSPKSDFDLVPEEKRPTPLPKDPVRWIFVLLRKPHSFIIQQCGLDGYFFLRYIYVMGIIFACGIVSWVVLLPVNYIGGNHNTGMDRLSFSNITEPKRYYAHAFISWIFYGATIYVIYRELFFFNSFRTAVVSSPKYSTKLSSRTVLFQGVPDTMLDEKQFHKLFNGVKRIHVSRDARVLTAKVNKREATALQLERATHKLLKTAMKAKMKADKEGRTVENPEDIDSWVPRDKRPRSGGLFKKKVDTIETCREELKVLDREIYTMQKAYKSGYRKNSIFVEFVDQYTAQVAMQSAIHHNPFRMTPVCTGIEQGDVDWGNMRIFWWEKIVRQSIALAAIIALIIFWAIPVAFVGVISNINYLIEKLPWLSFLNKCPKWIFGVITGLLPTVMLYILMTMLPIFIRAMAKIAGCVSVQQTEHYTQKAYFAFLMVNGFLITALASSASSTVEAIINQPSDALDILATNLPKSSNFYISYLILQGMAVASGSLLQIVGLFLYYILGTLFDKTLRKKWARFSGLGTVAYGTTFPPITLLVVVTLAYSIISPLMLLFAAVAFCLLYICWCHNLTFIFVEGPDARGAHYPRALFQTFTGLYIGEVALLGLFIVGKGWGPIVLEVIMIAATIFAHLNLKAAFDHLLTVVPIDCMKPLDGVSSTPSFAGTTDYQTTVLDRKKRTNKEIKELISEDRAEAKEVREDMEDAVAAHSLTLLMADKDNKNLDTSNPITRFFRPDVFLNYRHVKPLIPASYNVQEEIVDDKHAYSSPAVSAKMPILWIPKDPMGWSTREIELNKKVVQVFDTNSTFDEKGKIHFIGPPPY